MEYSNPNPEPVRVDNPSNAPENSTSHCTSDFTGRVSILYVMKKKFLLLITTCLSLICIGCSTVSKEENKKTLEKVYFIQPRDTFAKIAQMHNLSVEELVEMNPNKDPRRLYIGEPIKISK